MSVFCEKCGNSWGPRVSTFEVLADCPWCQLAVARETIVRLSSELAEEYRLSKQMCRDFDAAYERIRLQEEIIAQAEISDGGLGTAKEP